MKSLAYIYVPIFLVPYVELPGLVLRTEKEQIRDKTIIPLLQTNAVEILCQIMIPCYVADITLPRQDIDVFRTSLGVV